MNTKLKMLVVSISALIISACGEGSTNTPVVQVDKELTQPNSVELISKFKEGVEYIKISKPIIELKGRTVEFASYSCSHCETVYPLVNLANSSLETKIEVMHVTRTKSDINLVRAAYMEALKHVDDGEYLSGKLYKGSVTGRLGSEKLIKKLIVDNAVNPEKIFILVNSDLIANAIKDQSTIQSKIKIPGTPYFIIDGRYTLNLKNIKNWKQGVEVVKFLSESI